MRALGSLRWAVLLTVAVGLGACGGGDEFTAGEATGSGGSAEAGEEGSAGGSGAGGKPDAQGDGKAGGSGDASAESVDAQAEPDVSVDAPDEDADVSIDSSDEDAAAEASDDADAATVEAGVDATDAAADADANGCGPDGAACVHQGQNGLCLAGACAPCAAPADDALCQAAYGSSAEPSICRAGACVPGCRADGVCATGHCVDEVCCDVAASQCQGCKACNLAGSQGTCANVPGGQDPHDSCAANPATCTSSACDGAGTCAVPDQTPCGATTCTGGTESDFACVGGTCQQTQKSCGSFGCSGSFCGASCTVGTDAGCPAGTFCLGGTACSNKLGNGTACAAANQCLSGNCVDSVCCDTGGSSCAGCKACNLAGSLGICTNVPSGQDPHDACTPNVSTCTADLCDGNGTCSATNGTSCGAPTCTNGSETDPVCLSGLCGATQKSCGNFACGGSTCATSCSTSTNAGCKAGFYCVAGTSCAPKQGPGAACTDGSQCTSGNCVDGVCCDTAPQQCGGCKACNVAGSVGTCTSVPAGQDPHATCTANVATCVSDFCDGSGTCTAPNGTSCGATSCAGGVETDPVCQGGSCGSSTKSCGSFGCNGTLCGASCTVGTDAGCPSGTYCLGGTSCAPKLVNGSACGGQNQCTSGNCTDSVCCDTAPAQCGGCKACNVAGQVGTCSNVPSGQDPHAVCNANVGACAADNCNGAGTCSVADGTSCGGSSCSNGSETDPVCQGGTCGSSTKSCGTFACSGGTCAASCTVGTDAGCVAGTYCVGGTSCAPNLGNGTACGAGDQCTSGNCVDGVCCNQPQAACGACFACNLAGAVGVCTAVPAGQDPHDSCTAKVASCTADNCDGSGTCSAPNGTSCGAQVCTNGTETDLTCGGGACQTAVKSCGSFSCAGTACATSCTVGTDAGCAAGFYCVGGTSCVAKLANGSVCTVPDQCASGNCIAAQAGLRCSAVASCPVCQVVSTTGTSCVVATAGTDPKNECTANVGACLTDNCNGSGACTSANGTVCGASVCIGSGGGFSEEDFTCGSGTCNAATKGCGNYVCASGACKTTCAGDADCRVGFFCWGAACIAQLGQGGACTGGNQCLSGNCVDGFCCDVPAASCGGCMACSAAKKGSGANGACGPVVAGGDPNNFCNPNAATCTGANCNGSGSCAVPNGTTCAGPSCAGSTETDSTCTGGACGTTAKSCGNFTCSGSTCGTTCIVGTDVGCVATAYCVGGTSCVTKQALGATCGASDQCQSGNCVDGVCCSTSSCGSCQACNVVNFQGVCTNVPANTDPHGDCPANTSLCRAGSCNGSGACKAAPLGTVCGTASCTESGCFGQCSGTSTSSYVCDGTTVGSCPTGTVQAGGACPNNLVCASSTTCLSSCGVDADCATGFYCLAGGCKARLAKGQSCTANDQCLTDQCTFGLCNVCDRFSCGVFAPICYASSSGGQCGGPCGSNSDCTISGLGTSCNLVGFPGANCVCGSGTDCNAHAANCGLGSHCQCGTSGASCSPDQYCTDRTATGTCKFAPGYPCINDTDCASGTCTAKVCSKLAATQPCMTGTDCKSGTCTGYTCL